MITDELACCFCAAHRFKTRQALAEHEMVHRLAELAARQRDPLVVLREAIVWAIDEDWFDDLNADIRAMLAPARLTPGKPTPGYPACLLGQVGDLSARVTISADGATLQVMLARRPRLFHRTRLHLPAQFALPVDRPPVLRDSRQMAERLAEAAARGLADERAEVMQ